MFSFAQALRRHALLSEVVSDENRAVAEDIYAGVTGLGQPGPYAIAVADTMPTEYAVLLATEDIAAAVATRALLETYWSHAEPTTPRQARKLADLGWEHFAKEVKRASTREVGLPGSLGGAWLMYLEVQSLKPDPEKMRRIALLAGRMYRALKGEKSKRVPDLPEEIVGVEGGANIAGLIPGEYAMLATDPTRRHLFKQLSEKRALQFQRTGKDVKARGPLVIAIDESASMTGPQDEWAKAAMTALTAIAWEDKRPVVIVHFSTGTKAQVLMPGDAAGLVRAQHTFLNGGTDIGAALRVSLDEIKALAAKGYTGADAVLVSDGGDAGGWIDPALDELEAAGGRLWSVAIGVPFQGSLLTRASAYVYLDERDMTSTAGATKLAGAIL